LPEKTFEASGQLTAEVLQCILVLMKTIFLLAAFVAALKIVSAQAADSIYSIPLKDIDGKDTSLKPYEGKVMLVVNVASKCGYTPQYTQLESIYEKYKGQGLTIVGFPCNQFGGQEPKAEADIKQFCTSTYNVTFPMFSKIEVNGPNRNPVYGILAGKDSPYAGDIKWNFTKFLVSRDGRILKRFESKVKPDAPEVTQAIEAALAAK
jgi:glutathione peroxidase